MGMIEFTAGESSGFEVLPEGTYNFRITKVEAKPTKAGDGNSLHVKCKVIDGPYEDKTQTLFCTLKPEKGWQLATLLSSAIPGNYESRDSGSKDDEGKPILAYAFDTEDLVDATFTADIAHRKDDRGQLQSDWKKIRELAGSQAAAGASKEAAADAASAAATTADGTQPEGGEQRTLRRRMQA